MRQEPSLIFGKGGQIGNCGVCDGPIDCGVNLEVGEQTADGGTPMAIRLWACASCAMRLWHSVLSLIHGWKAGEAAPSRGGGGLGFAATEAAVAAGVRRGNDGNNGGAGW